MAEGMILKALSGFYYVDDGTQLFACRGRGKFRHEKVTPLVGDRVLFTPLEHGSGSLDGILPRKNEFQRPAVANVDQLVIIVSQAVPATDPFLIDRVISIAERRGCDSVICVNKWDLVPGEDLYQIYTSAGFTTLKVSAETGEGSKSCGRFISGKVSAFTGNSGVGKSSILNALEPGIARRQGRSAKSWGGVGTPPAMWSSTGWAAGLWWPTPRGSPPLIRTAWSFAARRSWRAASGSLPLTWENASLPVAPM